jgi:ABC-type phosphate transport system ATPase subunit
MQHNDKEIFIKETNGMFDMLAKIFGQTVNANGNILENNLKVRKQFFEIIEKFAEEYRFSHRADIFFGYSTAEEIRNNSYDYAIDQTLKLFNAFGSVEDQVFNRFIQLSGKAPKEFLKAIKDILNPTNRDGR